MNHVSSFFNNTAKNLQYYKIAYPSNISRPMDICKFRVVLKLKKAFFLSKKDRTSFGLVAPWLLFPQAQGAPPPAPRRPPVVLPRRLLL